MKTQLIMIAAALVSTTALKAQTSNYQSDKVKKVWEAKGLSVPESVYPIPSEKIMYVSNVGSKDPTAKDSTGFISILTFDGRIKAQKWVTGLNAPKGMGIKDNTLYVSDIDRVVGIDLKTGKKTIIVPVEGSKFLNDIVIDKSVIIYVSDSQTGSVYKIENGKASVFVHADSFKDPNGILLYNGKILLGVGDRVVQIDPKTGKYVDYITNTGVVDGLAMFAPDQILISDWSGKVQLVKKTGEKEVLLDSSKDQGLNAADLGYLSDSKTMYVPTFFGNSVACYKIK